MTERKTGSLAFTLVEAMFTITMTGILLAAAAGFVIEMSIGHYIVDQRISQSIDARRFSQELIYNATRANQLFLYKSSTATDRDSPADELTIDSSDVNNILHPAGDFVVFVFYEFPKDNAQTYHRIQKIIGYYLGAAAPAVGAIKKITIDLSRNINTGAATPGDQVLDYDTTNSKTVVEQVMTNNWSSAIHTSFDTFALNARGLFKSETLNEGVGRLFYYRDAQKSLMAAGQLYGTSAIHDKRTYTDTFNFSITPRS